MKFEAATHCGSGAQIIERLKRLGYTHTINMFGNNHTMNVFTNMLQHTTSVTVEFAAATNGGNGVHPMEW